MFSKEMKSLLIKLLSIEARWPQSSFPLLSFFFSLIGYCSYLMFNSLFVVTVHYKIYSFFSPSLFNQKSNLYSLKPQPFL